MPFKEWPCYFAGMSKQQKGGTRSALHYIIEFAVILLGISISVYIEKNNAREYKENIKNQSLERILSNIQSDRIDFEFNIAVHEPAAESCKWLFDQKHNMEGANPDSVGKHCAMCIMGQTIFVDNQEEYRTLQNSGLMELIENDKLARALQDKYVQHGFMRKIETYVQETANTEHDTYYSRMETPDEMEAFMGYIKLRRWNGKPLSPRFLERMSDIGFFHSEYCVNMRKRKEQDVQLTTWIREEIGETAPRADQ